MSSSFSAGAFSHPKQQQGSESAHAAPQFSSITAYLHNHGYRMGKIIGEGSYSKVRLTTRYFSDGTPAYRLASKVISKSKQSSSGHYPENGPKATDSIADNQ